MNETRPYDSKVIGFYEAVRANPAADVSAFSDDYDDVPWEARVEMERFATYARQGAERRARESKRPASRESEPKPNTPDEVTGLAFGFLILGVLSFGTMLVIWLSMFVAHSGALLLGVSPPSGELTERLIIGGGGILVVLAGVGFLGAMIFGPSKDENDSNGR